MNTLNKMITAASGAIDYIFYNPTIKAFYSDGSEQVIMNKGNLIYNT